MIVTLEFTEVLEQCRLTAEAFEEPIAQVLLEYAPSIIGAHQESVTLRVPKSEVGKTWTPELHRITKEHLDAIRDELDIPCKLKVVTY